MIVAVDGPSGAGKSTVCREVARRLGLQLVDTGALYRALTHQALERGIAPEDGAALGELAASLQVAFEARADGQRVLLDGVDVTDAIRTAQVSRLVSPVSAHREVREALLDQQRALGTARDSIVEGRDIGTVVFPTAELKVYYTASVHARALRRHAEMLRRGESLPLEAVERDIEERDERDRNREVAPLRVPEGAVVLDTSGMDFEEACRALEALITQARAAA